MREDWDSARGTKILDLSHGGLSVAFSPDGQRLASGGNELRRGQTNTATVWDVSTGKELFELKGHGDVVLGVAFSPDGNRLASGSRDNTVKIWNCVLGNERSLKGPPHPLTYPSLRVVFSPNGQRLAAQSQDTINIWDVATGEPLEDKFARMSAQSVPMARISLLATRTA